MASIRAAARRWEFAPTKVNGRYRPKRMASPLRIYAGRDEGLFGGGNSLALTRVYPQNGLTLRLPLVP